MPNRLIKEKSPYLLQHANNPVDWYPWADEAFEKAKREDKPVFLSIGYSTCHWCHVMERESFEDSEVAGILNNGFVSIKVDREERPDIDHIYMSVCQAMTGQGGWPLTVLMTPEKKPFFAGTYFPKHEKWGRPGLVEILTGVGEKWKLDRASLAEAGEQVVTALFAGKRDSQGQELTEETLLQTFFQARGMFDKEFAGFGTAPKFPTPHNLTFLLRYWKRRNDKEALDMVEHTLERMYRGGIYDHIGYGFSRYSTDRKWLVPHFEKMLYDNALLALAYIEGYQATGRKLYARVAKEILTYVLRDMTSPEGGFYSAEDADSEGEEGKFYVWTPAEIKDILGDKDGEIYCSLFDITAKGNFEGRNIPNLIAAPPFNEAGELTHGAEENAGYIESLRNKLFNARKKRVHPYKDDKVLTSWNGLMIAALARGAAVFGEAAYREAAVSAVEFIMQKLRRTDGRLLARYRDGEAAYPAYLDDYAFLAWGLWELYEADFAVSYLERALALTSQMIDLFWDAENGGFYFNGKDAEQLISRPKEVYDGAMPSGNSVALLNLLRLARLTANEKLTEIAERQIKAFSGSIGQYPWGYTHFLMGIDFMLGPTREIVIAGRAGETDTESMLRAVRQTFMPDTVMALHPEGEAGGEIEKLVPFMEEQRSVDGKAAAYVCENYACQAPVTDLEQFVEMLRR
ncbi:MAG: thioredoxin domain-containing protein [Desulfotomaculaceae bacterium]|nr:thioredoxin domain-containing protein [Desulfotomaculaceae bacterium]MDD4766737.1 thioredoxin domain-containing protein [Desulfotomaculaceae bacterium]